MRLADAIQQYLPAQYRESGGGSVIGSLINALEASYGERIARLEEDAKNSRAVLQVAEDKLREAGFTFNELEQIEIVELRKALAKYRAKWSPQFEGETHQRVELEGDRRLSRARADSPHSGPPDPPPPPPGRKVG